MPVETGQDAPDFTLKDQDGNDVALSSFRGNQSVVIVFYPFTFTGVCQGELCSLRDDLSEFEAVKAQVLAISCDSRHAQKQWAEQQGFTFPVLSDFWPHGAVSRAYGVFNEQLGCANRATFVIDQQGKVVDTFASPNLGTPRERAEYEAALAKLELSAHDMVRFSDMLGGDGNADDASAKTAPRDLPPPVVDDAPDPDGPPPEARLPEARPAAVEEPEADDPAESAAESAQDVLDRLTQYATASRAADQPAPQPAPVAVDPSPAPDADGAATRNPANDGAGAGDDILPRGKRSLRNPRGSKRAK